MSSSSCPQSLASGLKLSNCPLSMERSHGTQDILWLPKSQRTRHYFLSSPCPLLVESSFAGKGGGKTGFLTPPEPITVIQQSSELGSEMGEARHRNMQSPSLSASSHPWGSHVSPLKTLLRDRPHPPSGHLTLARPPNTYLVSAWPAPGESSRHTPSIPLWTLHCPPRVELLCVTLL